MSVGGRLIEILPMRLPESGRDVVRLWVVDRPYSPGGIGDETCVYAEPAEIMPKLGEVVWWQSGRIYFDQDRRELKKVGFSFPAPGDRQ